MNKKISDFIMFFYFHHFHMEGANHFFGIKKSQKIKLLNKRKYVDRAFRKKLVKKKRNKS